VIIAIDGPAGSGKSSTAKEVARRVSALYIDTGAMYRAVALSCLRHDLTPESDRLFEHLQRINIEFESSDTGLHVFLDGEDVSDAIRDSKISEWSSRFSKMPAVRERLVSIQRELAKNEVNAGGKVVMEGRDIGTVVFPHAELKVFLRADPAIRAERRVKQLQEKGTQADVQTILREIIERDTRDESREMSPLVKAADAIELDTSGLSFEEQVENIIGLIQGNG